MLGDIDEEVYNLGTTMTMPSAAVGELPMFPEHGNTPGAFIEGNPQGNSSETANNSINNVMLEESPEPTRTSDGGEGSDPTTPSTDDEERLRRRFRGMPRDELIDELVRLTLHVQRLEEVHVPDERRQSPKYEAVSSAHMHHVNVSPPAELHFPFVESLYQQHQQSISPVRSARRQHLTTVDVLTPRLPEVPGYRVTRAIGAGRCGTVVLASKAGVGPAAELFAIKMIQQPPRNRRLLKRSEASSSVSRSTSRSTDRLVPTRDKELTPPTSSSGSSTNEIGILKRVRHKNIVPLEEVIDVGDVTFVVMPYVENGPVVRLQEGRCPPLDVDIIRGYMRQLLAAVAYLHRRHIVHCDIKPDNILLGANGRIYLADFGVSRLVRSASESHSDVSSRFSRGTPTTTDVRWPECAMAVVTPLQPVLGGRSCSPPPKQQQPLQHTLCTPAYAAPETLTGLAFNGAAADMWSCGVTMYVMLFGRLPFPGAGVYEVFRIIESATDVEYPMPTLTAEQQAWARAFLSPPAKAPSAGPPSADAASGAYDDEFDDTRSDVENVLAMQLAIASCRPASAASAAASPSLLSAAEHAALVERLGINARHGLVKRYAAAFGLLDAMLSRDPARRVAAAEALLHPFLSISAIRTVSEAATTAPPSASSLGTTEPSAPEPTVPGAEGAGVGSVLPAFEAREPGDSTDSGNSGKSTQFRRASMFTMSDVTHGPQSVAVSSSSPRSPSKDPSPIKGDSPSKDPSRYSASPRRPGSDVEEHDEGGDAVSFPPTGGVPVPRTPSPQTPSPPHNARIFFRRFEGSDFSPM